MKRDGARTDSDSDTTRRQSVQMKNILTLTAQTHQPASDMND